jgi:branched-subunit amino acid transport protein
MTMNPWVVLLAIVGLGVVTLVTRCFFLLPERPLPLPGWIVRALRYAPLGALAAIVLPEIIMSQGRVLPLGLADARLAAAAVATAYFVWRRGILGTIVSGMLVYLPLHIGLGW